MKKAFLIGDSEKLISELSDLLRDRCEISGELDKNTDIVFELTNYGEEMKFNLLDYIAGKNENATIVSSSLCLSVLRQSHYLNATSRIVGAAFYPGFSSSKAIELSACCFTDKSRLVETEELFKSTGKEIISSPDRPGMTAMRIISMIINEAYLVMQEGTSIKEDIDTAMKLGTNYPYGPIEWSEKLGLNLVCNVIKAMHEEFGEDRYRLTPLLREKSIEELSGL